MQDARGYHSAQIHCVQGGKHKCNARTAPTCCYACPQPTHKRPSLSFCCPLPFTQTPTCCPASWAVVPAIHLPMSPAHPFAAHPAAPLAPPPTKHTTIPTCCPASWVVVPAAHPPMSPTPHPCLPLPPPPPLQHPTSLHTYHVPTQSPTCYLASWVVVPAVHPPMSPAHPPPALIHMPAWP